MQKEKEQILRSAPTIYCSPPFHKEGERGWIKYNWRIKAISECLISPYSTITLNSLNSLYFLNSLSLLLLLIFAESVSDIAHSEAKVIRIVAGLQPKLLSESCAIGGALYAKRKGANLAIGSYNRLSPPFHKEGERGWIVNIIGGSRPTLNA